MTRLQFALGYALAFLMVAGALVLAGVHSAARHVIEIKYQDPSAGHLNATGGSTMPLAKPANNNSSTAQ